jgi:flagellar biosynthesis/type III secretory pathway chaperone
MEGACQSNIEELCDSLLIILSRELPLYEELAAALRAEAEALRQPLAADIFASIGRKENCLLKLRILEEARNKVMNRINALLGKRTGEIGLSFLADQVEEKEARKIREMQARLVEITTIISDLNGQNMSRLQAAMEVIGNSLSLLDNLLTGEAPYRPGGISGETSLAGRFVRTRG